MLSSVDLRDVPARDSKKDSALELKRFKAFMNKVGVSTPGVEDLDRYGKLLLEHRAALSFEAAPQIPRTREEAPRGRWTRVSRAYTCKMDDSFLYCGLGYMSSSKNQP